MGKPHRREARVAESPAPTQPSLSVRSGGALLFSSRGRWLHPLFELEEFLRGSELLPGCCTIEDKIIGKAAAVLITRMGFRTAFGQTMSRLAAEFFEDHGVSYTAGELVDRIDCRTESLLAEVDDVEEAYNIVRGLAGR